MNDQQMKKVFSLEKGERKMANMLENFGLKILIDEDEALDAFLQYVAKNGRIFPGYSNDAAYLYKDTGTSEFWFPLRINEEEKQLEVCGMHTHAGNMNIWEMKFSEIDITPKRSSVLEHIALLSRADGGGMLPVDIVNADVLPSLMKDDVISVQVTAFPIEIDYYKNEEEYAAAQTYEDNRGRKWQQEIGTLLPLSFLSNHAVDTYQAEKEYVSDQYVHFVGKVKHVYSGSFVMGDKEYHTYYRCIIDTNFGELELNHAPSQIADEQREYICEGSIVGGVCIISGDVAIAEYAGGAIKDHDLKLLRYVISSGKSDKLFGVLKEYTLYQSDSSGREFVGPKAITERIKYVHDNLAEDDRCTVSFATITQANHENAVYPVGTRCLVLSYSKTEDFESIIFIDVDAEGMITHIKVSTDAGYKFKVDELEKNDDFLERFHIPENVEEAMFNRAIVNCILGDEYTFDDADTFINEADDYQEFLSNSKRMYEELCKFRQEDINRLQDAVKNSFSYLFTKSVEAFIDRIIGLPNQIISFDPENAFGVILLSIDDESLMKMFERAIEEGEAFYIDFKNYLLANDDDSEFENLYYRSTVFVQKLGKVFAKEWAAKNRDKLTDQRNQDGKDPN